MRVVLIPPRPEYQALLLLLQRGVVAALAAPHPFAPTSAMMAPRRCEPASPAQH
jgi:hypothetical protein